MVLVLAVVVVAVVPAVLVVEPIARHPVRILVVVFVKFHVD